MADLIIIIHLKWQKILHDYYLFCFLFFLFYDSHRFMFVFRFIPQKYKYFPNNILSMIFDYTFILFFTVEKDFYICEHIF